MEQPGLPTKQLKNMALRLEYGGPNPAGLPAAGDLIPFGTVFGVPMIVCRGLQVLAAIKHHGYTCRIVPPIRAAWRPALREPADVFLHVAEQSSGETTAACIGTHDEDRPSQEAIG